MATSGRGEDVASFLLSMTRHGSWALGKVAENGITIVIAVLGLLVGYYLGIPSVDPREPPLFKPRIPFIGHIIGLFQHQADYHKILSRGRPNQPIATLQMLTGKMYAIWDPVLISSGLRNKHLSVNPHVKAVAPILALTSEPTTKLIRSDDQGEYLCDRIMHHAVPIAFKGDHLSTMTNVALSQLSRRMSSLANVPRPDTGDEVIIPNVWLWIRDLVTDATTLAMYGRADPFRQQPKLEQALWDQTNDLLALSVGILPGILAPVGNRGRAMLFKYLTPYYSAKLDQDESASAFVRNRAHELRGVGISDGEVAQIESLMPFVGTTNTVPTLFWLFGNVFSRPELAERLRVEIEKELVAKREGDEVTLLVGVAIEDKCPLLWSCYKETLRLAGHGVRTRTVMQDTVVSDGDGKQYLLKKDCVVQMAVGVGHTSAQHWGHDVDTFNPDRFLSKAANSMRSVYQPFGGGVHLCPGRHFSTAETMAVVATMVLAFEVRPMGGQEWKLPGYAHGSIVDTVTKPVKQGEGFGVRVKRRDGWRGVQWKYVF